MTRKLSFTLLYLTFSLVCFAQEPQPEMADVMRSNGKIYVVLSIILIVLLGFVAYLVMLDRKLTKIEKSLKK
jgi:hypothetical protein